MEAEEWKASDRTGNFDMQQAAVWRQLIIAKPHDKG